MRCRSSPQRRAARTPPSSSPRTSTGVLTRHTHISTAAACGYKYTYFPCAIHTVAILTRYMEGFLLSRAAYTRIVHEYPDFRSYIQVRARVRIRPTLTLTRTLTPAPTSAVTPRRSRGCASTSARLHTRRSSRWRAMPSESRAGQVSPCSKSLRRRPPPPTRWRRHCLSRSKTRRPRASCAGSTNARAAAKHRRAYPEREGLASPPPSKRCGKAPPLPWSPPPAAPLPCWLLLPQTSARRHPAARPDTATVLFLSL